MRPSVFFFLLFFFPPHLRMLLLQLEFPPRKKKLTFFFFSLGGLKMGQTTQAHQGGVSFLCVCRLNMNYYTRRASSVLQPSPFHPTYIHSVQSPSPTVGWNIRKRPHHISIIVMVIIHSQCPRLPEIERYWAQMSGVIGPWMTHELFRR